MADNKQTLKMLDQLESELDQHDMGTYRDSKMPKAQEPTVIGESPDRSKWNNPGREYDNPGRQAVLDAIDPEPAAMEGEPLKPRWDFGRSKKGMQ